MSEGDYNEIMKIAFQAEEGIDDDIIRKFGKNYSNKQVLIKEGDFENQIYWILSGEVYITKKIGKKYKIITTLGKGEIIGEMNFFDKSVRSATVVAKGDVHALVFTRQNFTDIFKSSPQWSERLLFSLSTRICNMINRLMDLDENKQPDSA